jgi:hypothetical protein
MSMSCTTGQLCTATSAARQTPDTPDEVLVRSIAAGNKHAMRCLHATTCGSSSLSCVSSGTTRLRTDGRFIIGFSNQCERNYSLDRSGWKAYFNHCLSKRNKMSNLTSFIVLAGLLFFPGPAPADEAESIAALCARPGLQALREAQEEMTVRDTAAATGIKESTLRQLLKGLPKEGEIRCGG